jgi:hypothetical protein
MLCSVPFNSGNVPVYKIKQLQLKVLHNWFRQNDNWRKIITESIYFWIIVIPQYWSGSKALPAGIGSLIYFSADPVLRNTIQKYCQVEETRLWYSNTVWFRWVREVFERFILFPLHKPVHGIRNLRRTKLQRSSKRVCRLVLIGLFSPMIDVLVIHVGEEFVRRIWRRSA